MRYALAFFSALTCLVSGWMGVMYLVLRHPHYEWRAALAAVVFAGAATLLAGRPLPSLRLTTILWGAALAGLGVWALVSPNDDGWVLIAGSLFAVEGILAVSSATRRGSSGLLS